MYCLKTLTNPTELASKEQLYTQLMGETKKRIEELNFQYSTLKKEYDTLRKQYEEEIATNTTLKLQLETERQQVRLCETTLRLVLELILSIDTLELFTV
jgi:regulator of replication initiation timing